MPHSSKLRLSCKDFILALGKLGLLAGDLDKDLRNKHCSMAISDAAGYRCTASAMSLGEWCVVGIDPEAVVYLCEVMQ